MLRTSLLNTGKPAYVSSGDCPPCHRCFLELVQHCVINSEFCTCYFCQYCVVVNQRCHRIASFFRLVLTEISGTLFTVIYAMLY